MKFHASSQVFVALPPTSSDGSVVFGKNAVRPVDEIQEVVYIAASDPEPGSIVKCTFKEVPQASHVNAVVLNKSGWTWGAEMGANEHGICIGCSYSPSREERESDENKRCKLLGVDLVRLGLERSETVAIALDVITSLLETHGGMGDFHSESSPSKSCKSEAAVGVSFLIADASEVWVLEVVGKHWAAERVTSSYRGLSDRLTIETRMDKSSKDIKDYAVEKKWWSPDDGPFNFRKIFGVADPTDSDEEGSVDRMLSQLKLEENVPCQDFLKILRQERVDSKSFCIATSQLSVLRPKSSGIPSCHWITATSHPSKSLFKPFIFCEGASLGEITAAKSMESSDSTDLASGSGGKPRLWSAHKSFLSRLESMDTKAELALAQLLEMESNCFQDIDDILHNYEPEKCDARMAMLFQHMCELELNFY